MMQGQLPPVSVLICSRERPKLLQETVASVLTGRELPAELLVVDQSKQQHPRLAGWPAPPGCLVRYLWSDSEGLSRGRNIAIAAARHDILVIIDDDMLVERSWLGALVRALLGSGERTVVTGRVLPDPTAHTGGFVPALVTADEPAVYQGRLGRDVLAGGHMATYRSAFTEVGGFDERLGAGSRFPAADDNDLGFRLLEAGYRIVYEPSAVVYHRAWRSRRDYLPMRWRYGLGKGGFYAKHFGRSDRYAWRRLVGDLGQRAAAFPKRLSQDPRRACGDVVYSAGVVSGALQWSLSQRKTR